MKKFTIVMLAVFSVATAFAANSDKKVTGQNQKHPALKQTAFHPQTARRIQPANHSNAAPFYTEDFAGGLPASWSNVDSAGHGVRWTWTTIGCYSQAYAGIDSLSAVGTSAANGYAMFDSDSAGSSLGGDWGVLTTGPIDCSTHSTVHLTFNEFFAKYEGTGAAYPNTAHVYVSADGTSWTLVHAAETGLANNGFTANPNALDINISAVAAGHSTVYVRFSFTGDWSYFWFVDDVTMYEPTGTDGKLYAISDPFNGCTLTSTETISVGILNNGGTDITHFPVSYSVNGGTPVTDTVTALLHPGDTLTHTFATTADLSALGVYDVIAYLSVTNDTTNSNDTLGVTTVSVSPNAPYYFMGFETTDDYSAYSVEDVDGDGATIDISPSYPRSGAACLRYQLPGNTTPDNWVFTSCFDLQSGTTYMLDFWQKIFAVSIPYNLEAYIGTSATHSAMTLLIAPPVPTDTTYNEVNTTFTVPSTGTYYFGFRAFGVSVDNTLRVDDITVDLANKISTQDLNTAISVYPNPTTGKIFIENNGLKDKQVTITVLNAVGQVVSTRQYDNLVKESIDLVNQPDGLYTVQLKTVSGVSNKTIVLSNK